MRGPHTHTHTHTSAVLACFANFSYSQCMVDNVGAILLIPFVLLSAHMLLFDSPVNDELEEYCLTQLQFPVIITR